MACVINATISIVETGCRSDKLWKVAKKYGFTISFTYRFRFRFMCRALEAFLLAQMPSNSLLRLDAKAPEYVREPKKVQSIPLNPLNSRLKYADKLWVCGLKPFVRACTWSLAVNSFPWHWLLFQILPKRFIKTILIMEFLQCKAVF